MLLAAMQVDHGCGKAAVTEQFADSHQVHSSLQEPRRIRMPERMWSNVLVDVCFGCSQSYYFLNDRSVEWHCVCQSREQEARRPKLFPVDSQCVQEPRRDRNVSILATLALNDFQLHPSRVDILEFEVERFGESQSGSIEDDDNGSVLCVCDA